MISAIVTQEFEMDYDISYREVPSPGATFVRKTAFTPSRDTVVEAKVARSMDRIDGATSEITCSVWKSIGAE